MLYEVILDSGETPNKCTIAPLRHRADFRLIQVKGNPVFGPLDSSILLHHQGQCLSTFSKSVGEVKGIASVDCVWRRLDSLLQRIVAPLPVLARIPDGFVTAYPRISSQNTDPEGGLATIEAIFVAAALLGNWDATLLSEYYFGRKFIEMNSKRFLELGVNQAADPDTWPILTPRSRNSRQRRRDRGRIE